MQVVQSSFLVLSTAMLATGLAAQEPVMPSEETPEVDPSPYSDQGLDDDYEADSSTPSQTPPVRVVPVVPVYIDNTDSSDDESASEREADRAQGQSAARSRLRDTGATIAVGAGATNFVGDEANDITNAGPSWNVRAAVGTNRVLGLEAAYIGSAQEGSSADVPSDATLVSTGAEAALRLTAPVRNLGAENNIDVRPFAFGGVGWQRYTFFGEDGGLGGGIQNADNLLTIPAGLGLDLGLGNVTLGGRITYRHAFDSELFGDADDDVFADNALHQWNAGAPLGVEF